MSDHDDWAAKRAQDLGPPIAWGRVAHELREAYNRGACAEVERLQTRLEESAIVSLRLREAHDEIELLRTERDEARAAIFEVIGRIVEHNHENARGLARFDLDEARCRKLATLYLEEAVDVVRFEDDLRRIRANSKRMDEILEQAQALIAETKEEP